MILITRSFLVFLFFAAVNISGCQPKPGKEPVEAKDMRIPVSVNDSVILSVDKSPMDMSYYPENYPQQKMITPDMENPVARVLYGRPQKKGRPVFGDSTQKQNVIQHYGKEWRLGANEATEIEFFTPVTIMGKKIAAGRYIMYCIPYADKWNIIFNENLYSWGLHIDKTKDFAEIELPVIKNNIVIEYFTMLFQNSTSGCELVMAWGNVKVVMPISFN